ncbi:MAG: DUF2141 domain-containing protein [Novosphingobium sp.]
MAPALLGVGDGGGDVSITVTGLRSAKGQVLGCLTALPKGFPDCRKDPGARKLAVPASPGVVLDFGRVPQGRYAVSLLHDENGNGKADMALLFPKEGFGFSRDAPVRFGPPRFERAAFDVAAGEVRQTVRIRYMF